MRICIISAMVVALFGVQTASAAIVFVDGAAPGGGDGATWATALTTIQSGIDAAGSGDGVFVKSGTYAESLVLKSNISLLGGFAGTEALPEERDLDTNETVIDLSSLPRPVRGLLLDGVANVQIDALTIQGAQTSQGGAGALVQNSTGEIRLSNCNFELNHSDGNGGGLRATNTVLSIVSSVFRDNDANHGGAISIEGGEVTAIGVQALGNSAAFRGGACYLDTADASITNCLFEDNDSNSGGGIHGHNTAATITATSFITNDVVDLGGGISWYGEPLNVSRCLFVGNTAGNRGGGGLEVHETNAHVADSLFTQNVAANQGGGAIRFDLGVFEVVQSTLVENSTSGAGGGIVGLRGGVQVRNSLLSGNDGNALEETGANITVVYCLFDANTPADFVSQSGGILAGADDINDLAPGAIGNLSGDPGFANAAALDFHLLGISDAIGRASSIYATPADLDGNDRPGEDGVPDIGAYEFYDEVAPNVLSITLAAANPTNAATVQFAVRFDEAVIGVGANDFQVVSQDLKAVSGAAVTNVQGERDQYLVTVNTGTGDGTLRLDLIDNDSIFDLANNPLGGPGSGNGTFDTGDSFEIDKTPPVLTLVGDSEIALEAGSFYVEPGVTAEDNRDGDITDRIGAAGFVDIGELGTYSIEYSVSDTAGNVAVPLTRTVMVVDTTAPIIQLFGENPVTVSYGQTYEDAGAFAFDAYDGDVSAQLQFIPPDVEFGLPGHYEFVFRVADSSGNIAESVRAVNIVDDVAPVITITGDTRVEVGLGQPYEDAGATAADNVDGDITGRIVVSGDLTTAIPGEYPITYTVADTAGNVTEAVRTVVVLDRPDFYVTPEIQFISSFARTVVFDVYNRSTASQPWKAEVIQGGSWCTIASGETGELFYGQIYVRSEDNPTADRRVAKIQISNAEKFALPIIVQVSQAPTPKGIIGCGGDAPQGSPWGDTALVAVLAAALLWHSRKGARQHG